MAAETDRKPSREELALAAADTTRPEPSAINAVIYAVSLGQYLTASVGSEPGWLVWTFRDRVETQIVDGELEFVESKRSSTLTDITMDGSSMIVTGDMTDESVMSYDAGSSVISFGGGAIMSVTGRMSGNAAQIVNIGGVEYKQQGGRHYVNGKEIDVPARPKPKPEPEDPDGPVRSKVWYTRAAPLTTVRVSQHAEVRWQTPFPVDRTTKVRTSEYAKFRYQGVRHKPCDLNVQMTGHSEVDLLNLRFTTLDVDASGYSKITRFEVSEYANLRATEHSDIRGKVLPSCRVSERARGYAKIDV